MSRNDFIGHHQPRQNDKKKHHRHGFNEDIQDSRHARVSFKNYVRELKESLIEDEFETTDGRPLTSDDEKFIIEDFKKWTEGISPEECGDDQLQTYAYEIAPSDLDETEVLSFLRNYTGD